MGSEMTYANSAIQAGIVAHEGGRDDDGAREAHHRIANNLAMIAGFVRLQATDVARRAQTMSPAQARSMLEETSARIETVGHLHRLLALSPKGGDVDLADYLAKTCDALRRSTTTDGTCEITDVTDFGCFVPADQAGPIALILTELVTNAMKYAHPAGTAGRINVSCRLTPMGHLMLEVADDGVGLPEGFNPKTDGGLGMRVVRSLAQQLGAKLEFVSTPLGLTVRVIVA